MTMHRNGHIKMVKKAFEAVLVGCMILVGITMAVLTILCIRNHL